MRDSDGVRILGTDELCQHSRMARSVSISNDILRAVNGRILSLYQDRDGFSAATISYRHREMASPLLLTGESLLFVSVLRMAAAVCSVSLGRARRMLPPEPPDAIAEHGYVVERDADYEGEGEQYLFVKG